MYILKTSDNQVLNMKNGKPFIYSSRQLAQLGKVILEGARKELGTLRIEAR